MIDGEKQEEQPHRSGYVALVGRPNVGKSTLLNALLGEKVAAVSDKPQTTRNRIVGVRTVPGAQIVFLDTPGIHAPHNRLNRYMVDEAERALEEVDLVYFMVDLPPGKPPKVHSQDAAIADAIRARVSQRPKGSAPVPVFLVINKVDLWKNKAALLPWLEVYAKLMDFAEVVPISAAKKNGVELLERLTIAKLPEGPAYYPADIYTDQAERFLAAEIVREKVFLATHEELPYSSAVTVEAWTEQEGRIEIHATIHVERDSQKGIIIGKGGEMLKEIGTAARLELNKMLGARVHLQLFVRVEPEWRADPRALRKLGYEVK